MKKRTEYELIEVVRRKINNTTTHIMNFENCIKWVKIYFMLISIKEVFKTKLNIKMTVCYYETVF